MDKRNLVSRIARRIVSSENVGKAFYRVMTDSESYSAISVTFNNDTSDFDRTMGWFDANLSRPDELDRIASKYGYSRMKGAVADSKVSLNGMTFTLCYEGDGGSDRDGFIGEVVRTYNAKEIG